MRVLQINATYALGSTGTIVRDIHHLCGENGIESFVVFSTGAAESPDCFYRMGTMIDHKIHALLCRVAGKQAYFSNAATRRLFSYIDSVKPDVVHLHNLHSNYINLNLLLEYLAEREIKTVVTLHDCWFFTGGCFHYAAVGCQKWKESCGKCIKQRQDTPALCYDASSDILRDRLRYFSKLKNITFVGASQWIANQLKTSTLGHVGTVTYLHNGVDTDVFSPRSGDIRQKLGLDDKKVILAPAGKWMLDVNAEALDYFAANLPADYVMVLFGYDGKLKRYADNVVFYGFTRSREEMAELYSMADVMANCSREDTLSTINLECQSCGTPVVTYDSTGMLETIDGDCGYAVKTGDYHGLYSEVMKVISTGKEVYSNKCREFILRNFEKVVNYNKYIGLYKSLFNEK